MVGNWPERHGLEFTAAIAQSRGRDVREPASVSGELRDEPGGGDGGGQTVRW